MDFDIGDFVDIFENSNFDDIDASWFDEELIALEDVKDDGKSEEPQSKRFKAVNEKDLENIVLDSRSKGTDNTTAWGVKVLKQWLEFHRESPDFEGLPKVELNGILRRFYAEMRTANGKLYSKSSFVGIRAAIHRHIRQPPFEREINILRDIEFLKANNVFNAMLKKIKQLGLDNPTHHSPISESDLEKIRSSQVTDTPSGLLKKVWFDLTLGFGRRGCENQRHLRVDSFEVKSDDTGEDYITMTHTEKTKNHPGGVHDRENAPNARIYATGEVSCPILSFRKYLSKLNPQNSAFYQMPKKHVSESDAIWFNYKPLGHNTLDTMMKTISKDCNLNQIYTNHCVRATTVTLLSHAGVESREIMKITGHKNQQSLASYNSDSSNEQKRRYSSILQNSSNASSSQSQMTPFPSTMSSTMTQKAFMSGFLQVSNSSLVVNNYFQSSAP